MDEPRSREWWDNRYQGGDIPWDTGVVPPEVIALVEGRAGGGGWALDLGCGTGTSSRYLAANGWKVIGIDVARLALQKASAQTGGRTRYPFYCLADASDLRFLDVRAGLALDIGCYHNLPAERRRSYIRSLAGRVLPGGYYLLYALERSSGDENSHGIDPAELAPFAPFFELRWAQHGLDRDRRSGWYLFRRHARADG